MKIKRFEDFKTSKINENKPNVYNNSIEDLRSDILACLGTIQKREYGGFKKFDDNDPIFDEIGFDINNDNVKEWSENLSDDEVRRIHSILMGIVWVKESNDTYNENYKLNETSINPLDLICIKINQLYPNKPNAYDLASYCFENYNFITGLPQSDRNEEGHFPFIFEELMDRYKIEYDDFQEEWNKYAYDDFVDDDDDFDDSIDESSKFIDNEELEELLNSEGEVFRQEIKGETKIIKDFLGKGIIFIDIDTSIETEDFKEPLKKDEVYNNNDDTSAFELYKTKNEKYFIVNKYSSGGGQSDSTNIIWIKN